MKRFRISKLDTIKASAVSSDGKLLSSLYDSGFSRIKAVEYVLLAKIPHYAGKEIEVRITNQDEETFKSYTIKVNK